MIFAEIAFLLSEILKESEQCGHVILPFEIVMCSFCEFMYELYIKNV